MSDTQTAARVAKGDRVKANLSHTFGLIAVITGGVSLLVAVLALAVREGTWVLLNTFSIAGIVLSALGRSFGGKVSSAAEPAVARKAASGRTLSTVGLILNIVATVLMVIALVILMGLVASGDYSLKYGF
ncbi:MAG: hypothetical protein JXD23_03220 [Spirochaetales bacterium]|nr:hypothetical protein [Spirochaetales bacterium]